MGIKGLIPLLKSISDDVNIEKYRGKRVAVDTYCWLHKAAYSCSYELCLNRPTNKHITYCMKRVRLLLSLGITPIMVFDGAILPQKENEEHIRKQKRLENKRKAMALLGKGDPKEAIKYFQNAVNVTPKMAAQLICELQKLHVEYVVAPYEADSQLAFLSRSDRVDCVVSEDSDLLVFGCKRVLFKMDSAGNGSEIRLEDFSDVSSVDLRNWTHTMFQEMCVLSGCDYLPSIVGVGLKKAYAMMNHYRTGDKVIKFLRNYGKHSVPKNYEEDFERAVQTFKYQLVFDTETREQRNLQELPSFMYRKDLGFLGRRVDEKLAIKAATGEIDPNTLNPFEGILVGNKASKRVFLEKENTKRALKRKKLTEYFEVYSAKTKETKSRVIKAKKIVQKISAINLKKPPFEEKEKSLKSPFLSARRISNQRSFGGVNFEIKLLATEKKRF